MPGAPNVASCSVRRVNALPGVNFIAQLPSNDRPSWDANAGPGRPKRTARNRRGTVQCILSHEGQFSHLVGRRVYMAQGALSTFYQPWLCEIRIHHRNSQLLLNTLTDSYCHLVLGRIPSLTPTTHQFHCTRGFLPKGHGSLGTSPWVMVPFLAQIPGPPAG